MNFIPDTKSTYYKAMHPKWAKISTLLQGEEAIKAAGKAYLPQLTGQTPAEYEAYKNRGSFFNAFAKTVEGLTGAVVRKEPSIETNPKVDELLGDVTLSSESIQEVIRVVIREVISFGYYGILVDMPPSENDVIPTDATPYFAMYPCTSILNFRTVQIGDEDKLVLLALQEFTSRENPENPLELIPVEHIRLMEIVEGKLMVRVFEKTKADKQGNDQWIQVGEDLFPKIKGKNLDFIPFVFFGCITNTPIPQAPPMNDLGNLNVKHWQVSVDYYHGLHYCGMPTPWAAGFGKSSELYIGAMKAWVSEDPQAKCGFLEFTGTGLTAMVTALDKLEKQMAVMGARMLEEQKKASEAADTVRMRYSGDTATISTIVSSVEQGIIKAIDLLGEWMGIEANTEVRMNREFVAQRLSAQDITALLQAYNGGGMSLDTFLYNLQVGELLPPDRTIDDEKAMISEGSAKETEAGLTGLFGGSA